MKNRTLFKLLIIGAVSASIVAYAATVSRITTFSDGSILTAAQLNAEFDNVVDNMNALTNDNISPSAAISASKISAAIKGSGITRNASTGALSVNVDGSSIEISGDDLQVKADGITGAMLNSNVVDNSTLEQTGTTLNIKDLGVTTGKIANGAVTRAKLASVGQQISSSSGYFITSSTSFTDVTNLSVTLTTTGRPIVLGLVADGSTGIPCRIISNSSTSQIAILQDSTIISLNQIDDTIETACGIIWHFYVPSAGTYTFKVQAKKTVPGGTIQFYSAKLIAYEL